MLIEFGDSVAEFRSDGLMRLWIDRWLCRRGCFFGVEVTRLIGGDDASCSPLFNLAHFGKEDLL